MSSHRCRHSFFLMGLLGLLAGLPAAASPLPNPPSAKAAAMAVKDPALRLGSAVRDSSWTPQTQEWASAWKGFTAAHGARWRTRFDSRSGRPSLISGQGIPWFPGRGNDLTWSDPTLAKLAPNGRPTLPMLEALAHRFLKEHPALLRLDAGSLRVDAGRSRIIGGGSLAFLHFDLVHQGLVVEGTDISFRCNSGNLVQVALTAVPDAVDLDATPLIDETQALAIVRKHAGLSSKGELTIVEKASLRIHARVADDPALPYAGPPGAGYRHSLDWHFVVRVPGMEGAWKVLVDAHAGSIRLFRDLSSHGTVQGGIHVIDNSGDQEARPFPHTWVDNGGFNNKTTDAGGEYPYTPGNANVQLDGSLAQVLDDCGWINVSTDEAPGDIDLGTGTLCDRVASIANTPAGRTTFFHLTGIKDLSLSYLTGSAVEDELLERTTAFVNLSPSCDPFWNGAAIQLYEPTGGCTNSGENAGIIAHEFGHALDQWDNGEQDDATGEATGDVMTMLMLHESCIGQNHWTNPCFLCNDETDCFGVRDVAERTPAGDPARPDTLHDDPWACWRWGCDEDCQGPLGYQCHCESLIISGAFWDMVQNMAGDMGHEAAWTRAAYLWFSTLFIRESAYTVEVGGCVEEGEASGCDGWNWYEAFRIADDDNGDLDDGTPNGCHIWEAFNAHGIACVDAPHDCFVGDDCATVTAPVVTADRVGDVITLSWAAVPGAQGYAVHRNVLGCNRGSVVMDVLPSTQLSFVDTQTQDGFPYYYLVAALPASDELGPCMPGTSECAPCAAEPSSVDAGGPHVGECLGPVEISGSASCGDCMEMSTLWEGVGVTFDDPDALTTTATTSGFGTFPISLTLRCRGAVVGTSDTTLTVEDTEAPVWDTVPGTITVDACTGSTDPSSTGEPTYTDDCPDAVLDFEDDVAPGPGCPGDEQEIRRTWTATDAAGNSVTHVQAIKVRDLTPPDITCPPDGPADCIFSHPPHTGWATAEDTCVGGTVKITYEDSPIDYSVCPLGTLTRRWTATDACGNEATCDQLIELTDTTPPAVACPKNVTIDACSGSTEPTSTGKPAMLDCDPNPSVSYVDEVTPGPGCPGAESVIARTWTVQDACRNVTTCVQTITLVDMEPPGIICPDDAVTDCHLTSPSNTGMATAEDRCVGGGGVAITYEDTGHANTQDCADNHWGFFKRIWTATDDCGNSSVCVQRIDIEDRTPPAMACLEDLTVSCGEATDPSATGTPNTLDNCDTPLDPPTYMDVVDDGPGCPGIESRITRTWTSVDWCGNVTTCVQVITVQDTTPPEITCPPTANTECHLIDPSDTGTPMASDPCAGGAVALTYADTGHAETLDCADNLHGRFTRIWTATDECGNTATCAQAINLYDRTGPTLICPDDITVTCGASTVPSSTGFPTVTDNCDPAPVVSFDDDFELLPGCPGPQYEIKRTWRAVDRCGNVSTCVQTIRVQDISAPIITCPGTATTQCNNIAPAVTGMPTAVDVVCGGSHTFTYVDTGHASSLTCPGGMWGFLTRVWTATDACGNTATCEQTINLLDTVAPVITCDPAVTVACGESTAPADLDPVTAVDNCDIGVPSLMYVDSDDPSCGASFTRTWSATDRCGNAAAACVQTITVLP